MVDNDLTEKVDVTIAATDCNYPKVDITNESKLAKFLRENRVFPRSYMMFWCYLSYEITKWFITQDDISTAQGIFLAAIVTSASYYGKCYSQHAPAEIPNK